MPDISKLSIRDKVGKIDLSQASLKNNDLVKKASDAVNSGTGNYKEELAKYFQNHNVFKQYFPKDHGFLEFDYIDHTRGLVYGVKFKEDLLKDNNKSFYSISTYMFIQEQANMVSTEVSKARFDFLALTNLRLFLVDRFVNYQGLDPILGDDFEITIEKLEKFLIGAFKHLSFLHFETEVDKNELKFFISAKDPNKCVMETIMIEYDVCGNAIRSLVANLMNQSSGQTTEQLFKTAIVESVVRELLKCVKPPMLIQL